MPPALLPDTNGVIMDDLLFICASICDKKRLQVFRLDRFEDSSLPFLLLPTQRRQMRFISLPSGSSTSPQMPCKRPQPARQACPLFLCSSLESALHNSSSARVGMVLVSMCCWRPQQCACVCRGGAPQLFPTSSLLRMKKGPNHRSIGCCPI